jgi:capsid protein
LLDWTDETDAEGFTDFYGLQRRAAREVFIAGEVFSSRVMRGSLNSAHARDWSRPRTQGF